MQFDRGNQFIEQLGPTRVIYFNSGSHVDQFGLLFYNARWYDPSLSRFTQPDTIVPNAGFPLDFDRYAYVRNNPLRYTDPSGHFCDEWGNCFENHELILSDNPDNPLLLPFTTPIHLTPIVFNDPTPSGLTLEGKDAYIGLQTIWSEKGGWWWSDDVFTLQEALALLLYLEASIAQHYDAQGVWHFDKPVIEALSYKWQKYCQAGWSSTDCLNKFWGYYEVIMHPPMDTLSRKGFRGGAEYVYLKGAFDTLYHSPIDTNSPTLPQGWVALQGGTKAYVYALAHQFEYSEGYVDEYGVYWLFIVLSVNQQNAFCDYFGLHDMCNLTGAP